MNPVPFFQIFECQNPHCRFRFPSNLTIEVFQNCPLCKNKLQPVGKPFANQKKGNKPQIFSPQKIRLLLDNLRSTHNVGSIFRTANCASISHIYCCGTTPTPNHSKFSKSSLTADETISWSYERNSLDIVQGNKQEGCAVVSVEVADNATSVFANSLMKVRSGCILLVVGNEISGVDPMILDESDSVVYIPMLGTKTSLNVSIAAAIALYSFRFSLSSSN